MLKLFRHAQVRKYISNMGWLASERVLRFISLAVTAVIIARYLKPEAYGLLNYAIAYVVLFSPISNLGIGELAVREFVNQKYKDGELLGTVLIIRICSAIIAILVISTAALYSNNDNGVKILIIIIALSLIFQAFDIFDKFFQAKTKAKFSAISYSTSLVVSTVSKVLLVILKAPLAFFALAYSLEFVVLAIALGYNYYNRFAEFSSFRFNSKLGIILLKEAIPVTISGILFMIYMRIDQIMIKDIRGSAELGLFSIAVKISEALYFIPLVITNSLMPSVLRAKHINRTTYNLRLQKLFDLLTWLGLPIIFLVLISAPLIVKLLGSDYDGAENILYVHAWTALLVFWSVATYKYHIAEKMALHVTLNTALGTIVNVALNFWLIEQYGGIGASISTIAAHFVSVVVVLLFYSRTRRLLIIILNSLNPVGALKRLKDLTFIKENE